MTEVKVYCKKLTHLNLIGEGFRKLIMDRMKNDGKSPRVKRNDSKKGQMTESFDWKNTLVASMGGYLHPVLVNGKELQELENLDELWYQ